MRIPRSVPLRMSSIRRLAVPLVLVLLAACNGDGLEPRALLGEWLQRSEAPARSGEWWRNDTRFTLRADGSYTWESRVWADWGRAGDKLAGYGKHDGRYEVRDDSLFLAATRTETWDHVSGGPHVHEVDQSGGRYRARVAGRQLVLDFVTFPAESAEQSTIVFRRD